MNPERVPLLSAMDQYSPVVETISSTVVLPEMNEAANQNSNAITHSENQMPNQVSSNHPEESSRVEEPPKPKTAVEGYLAKCGGCQSSILFPYGFNRIICSSCKSINYMTADSIPRVTRKALMVCPKCNASILYTIGCTHFKCICGSVLQIPIPDYYIPHFSIHS